MKGPDEQQGLFSRLPDDPEYWHDFTERIVADAGQELERLGETRREWWSEIARFSPLLAVGASAAVLVLAFLMSAGNPAELPTRSMDAYGLAPDDPLAMTLASQEAPPTMEILIAFRNAESEP